MRIKQIILRHMKMRMLRPFTTSLGTEYDKEFIVVEAKSEDGLSGWGESVAAIEPFYKEETVKTNWHILEDFLIPLVLEKPIAHPDELNEERFKPIRGNYMAKAAIEGAIWDLYARQQGIPLAKALGGEKKKIEVGISLGIEESVNELLSLVEKYVQEGYKRIKVKIKPGWDVEVVRAVRERFPDIQLMADANSAYTLADAERLKALDEFNLTMIEQPLAHDDIVDHAELQAQLKTPICLDESIHSVEDVRKAIKLGSCGVINIKIGRVGGLTEARKIHDLCKERNIPVWCGGMLEAGIGRAHNVAITTLSNFILPGDTAASSRYWEKDIITPEVTVEDGWITVPEKPGIGYEPDHDCMDNFTLYSKSYFA
ncbi:MULTISPECIES: o-succinylbenzoate synthase [Aneurinibacillus]|uniref:o-succinylbenzoate synthase n=1 Tax=Aneurinibacillus thermoaerophilus TaxID=143495 RepID=A0A1G8CTD3_ANETH|nr:MULTISPECIES: o-succinylbenzoate synthase [Aneurinibacillus]AMA74489.1 o-succinylbenzoate synthase [Aneurinibacillus sp. XH2]MED0677314.1 o-succinylbenzoate synthase [Aneurinibacillus thermoaerophilus]MED0738747.1 o-succinylbenzoate synthase [Aneurinibacillus thermoaerophilus]MED0757848.1 o-succinylbenzoate synthase [Aneurinibacillus thermoaerophilus]MED0761976.1 o-succinylbenzoate synthase [Aneurinibacillus thermoaerophilus]